MSSPAEWLRVEIEDRAAAIAPGKAALLLSGGLDSGITLAACLAVGLQPDLFSVTLGEHDTHDVKLARARAAALCPDCPYEVLRMPRTVEAARGVVQWCIRTSEAAMKAGIEVSVMLIPALDELARRGYRTVIHAMSGGVLWGVSREHSFAYSRDPREWQQMRVDQVRQRWQCYPPDAAMLALLRCRMRGMAWVDPLADCADYMLKLTNSQMNKPYPKALAVQAYPCLMDTPHVTSGMQVAGGAREFMTYAAGELGYRSALAWYADEARKFGFPVRGTAEARERFRVKGVRDEPVIQCAE